MERWTLPPEFEEYRIVRPIGQGGMGQVYLAHDTLLDRPVAVKIIALTEPDPAARERFLLEARAAARLQHPNVVAVYRVGQVDGRPYIISEYVRGKSLAATALPLTWPRVLEIGLDLTRGLSAAHRHGVLHRDIKPGNAMVAESGEVKLLDFGLAKLVDLPSRVEELLPATASPDPTELPTVGEKPSLKRPSGLPDIDPYGATFGGTPPPRLDAPPSSSSSHVLGTPYYMAPEVWRGDPASKQSDVYSMGALLYKIASGLAPHGDVAVTTMDELAQLVTDRDALPLREVAPEVEPRLGAIVDRSLRRDSRDRFASGDELREALERLSLELRGAMPPEGNPYRGLRPFEAEHRALFFGRGAETRTVIDRLRTDPFVLVAGDSGVGKSSLCRAGVVPLVGEGALGDGRQWTVAPIVPGRLPLTALATALSPVLTIDELALGTRLRDEPLAVARDMRKVLGGRRGLLIFIDQLEELVTLGERAEVEPLAKVIGQLAAGVPGVRLLASVRSDFLTRIATACGLEEEISRAFYLLRPLSPDDLREAVVGPARATGLAFESAELIDTLVRSTVDAQGGLPLLQFALAELWEARDTALSLITRQALDTIGGVDGALARHADGVLASLGEAQRRAARRLFLQLVTAEGTRARRAAADLDTDEAGETALGALVRGRLLCAYETAGGTSYELAHEALLSGWSTLRRWLDDQAGVRAVLHRLSTAAAEWARLGRSPEALWGARHLAEATALPEDDLDPRQRDFLLASRRAVRRDRRFRVSLLVGVPLLVAVALGGMRLKARRAVEAQIERHRNQAGTLLVSARSRQAEVDRLRSSAFALFDHRQNDQAEAVWSRSLELGADVERRLARATQALEPALSLDAHRPALRKEFAETLFTRAAWAEHEHQLERGEELLQRLSVYDDGSLDKRWRRPATLTVDVWPKDAQLSIERFTDDGAPRWIRIGPLVGGRGELPPGSYRLVADAPGRAMVRYPVLLSRGEQLSLALELPSFDAIPVGFVYVPGGRFLIGSRADENLRRSFFNTVPLHPVEVPAFLIARHETTFGEWLEFLRALPRAERDRRTPRVSAGFRGAVHLVEDGAGWRLDLQPTGHLYSARFGEPIRYRARRQRGSADWIKLPVSGISAEDGQAFVAWLDRSGRVPGARLCDELEWERAARGADGRDFPHGPSLGTDDANFDETYGKQPLAFGPDEVGSHPASRSPFGVDDLCGNVWEWVRASLSEGPWVARGGSYYTDRLSVRSSNRELPESSFRDPTVGLRVCATWQRH